MLAKDFTLIDAPFRAELRTHFSEAELIELGMMIGQYISFGRLLVIHDLHKNACEIYTPPA